MASSVVVLLVRRNIVRIFLLDGIRIEGRDQSASFLAKTSRPAAGGRKRFRRLFTPQDFWSSPRFRVVKLRSVMKHCWQGRLQKCSDDSAAKCGLGELWLY